MFIYEAFIIANSELAIYIAQAIIRSNTESLIKNNKVSGEMRASYRSSLPGKRSPAFKQEDELLSVGNCSFHSVYKGFVDCLTRSRYPKELAILPDMPTSAPIMICDKEKEKPADASSARVKEAVTRESSKLDGACRNLEQLKEIKAELRRMQFPTLSPNLGSYRIKLNSQSTLRLDSVNSCKKSDGGSLVPKNTLLNRFSAAKPPLKILKKKRRGSTFAKETLSKINADILPATGSIESNYTISHSKRMGTRLGSTQTLNRIRSQTLLEHKATGVKLSPLTDKGSFDIRVSKVSRKTSCNLDDVAPQPKLELKRAIRRSTNPLCFAREIYSDKGVSSNKHRTIKTDWPYLMEHNIMNALLSPVSMAETSTYNICGVKYV